MASGTLKRFTGSGPACVSCQIPTGGAFGDDPRLTDAVWCQIPMTRACDGKSTSCLAELSCRGNPTKESDDRVRADGREYGRGWPGLFLRPSCACVPAWRAR